MGSKSITTLISDIYDYAGGEDGLPDLLASHMGVNIASAIQQSLSKHEHRGLRLSRLGVQCPCALWYSYHHPELAEPLPPEVRIKFLFGHIAEHMLIGLAKAAGHRVEGEQDEITVDGILGHRDCVIDGCVVDVKSAATRSFLKFRDKTIAEDDSFGYLDQVDSYVLGSLGDPLVLVKDRGYLLAIDKQLGHLALYEHIARPLHIRQRIKSYKEIVAEHVPPRCTCGTTPDGESGNIMLDVPASYSAYKHQCFPSLRTFLYKNGDGFKPRFLTKVVKRPVYRGVPIMEVDKNSKVVYH